MWIAWLLSLLHWQIYKLFFSCCASFTWILPYKSHDLTDHQLTVESADSNYFLLHPPLRPPPQVSFCQFSCHSIAVDWQTKTFFFCSLCWSRVPSSRQPCCSLSSRFCSPNCFWETWTAPLGVFDLLWLTMALTKASPSGIAAADRACSWLQCMAIPSPSKEWLGFATCWFGTCESIMHRVIWFFFAQSNLQNSIALIYQHWQKKLPAGQPVAVTCRVLPFPFPHLASRSCPTRPAPTIKNSRLFWHFGVDSQWKGTSIASGCSQAPSSFMNLSLVMSNRSLLCTKTVQEKVHASIYWNASEFSMA